MGKTLLLLLLLLIPVPVFSAVPCPQYSSVVLDTRGNVQSGTTVNVFVAGTSTLATIYSDQDCTSPTTNPMTTTTDGSFTFYVKDARLDLTFTKSGYSFTNLVNVNVYNPLGDNVVAISNYTSTDICLAGDGAIDRIGVTVTTLVINKTATCGTTATIPSTLTIQFEGQGSVTVSGGVTLTVNGPVVAPHGRTVWSGGGTLVWGSGAGPLPYGWNGPITATYGATVAINNTLGTTLIITVTDTNAFTVSAPTANYYGCLKIRLRNTSGGAVGAITWNAIYKKPAFTSPADGQQRTYPFCYNGTNWVFETDDADTPN